MIELQNGNNDLQKIINHKTRKANYRLQQEGMKPKPEGQGTPPRRKKNEEAKIS